MHLAIIIINYSYNYSPVCHCQWWPAPWTATVWFLLVWGTSLYTPAPSVGLWPHPTWPTATVCACVGGVPIIYQWPLILHGWWLGGILYLFLVPPNNVEEVAANKISNEKCTCEWRCNGGVICSCWISCFHALWCFLWPNLVTLQMFFSTRSTVRT